MENLAHRQAHPDVRRAAHLREGLQPRRHHDAAEAGGAKWKIFQWAFKVGKRGLRASSGRASSRPACSRLKHGHRRQARLQQDPGAARRPDPDPGLRLGAAQQGDRRVLPRRRADHPRGVRPDRDLGRRVRQRAGRSSSSAPSAGRWATSRSASPRTARSSCAACRSCAATTTCPTESGELLHRRRLLQDRRHRRDRRRRLPEDHRPQEGPDQDLGRQVHRAEPHRGQFKAICPYVSQVVVIGQARNFVTMVVTLDPDAINGVGRRRAAGGQVLRGDRRRQPRPTQMINELRKASSTSASTAGRRSRSSPSCRGTSRWRAASSRRRSR